MMIHPVEYTDYLAHRRELEQMRDAFLMRANDWQKKVCEKLDKIMYEPAGMFEQNASFAAPQGSKPDTLLYMIALASGDKAFIDKAGNHMKVLLRATPHECSEHPTEASMEARFVTLQYDLNYYVQQNLHPYHLQTSRGYAIAHGLASGIRNLTIGKPAVMISSEVRKNFLEELSAHQEIYQDASSSRTADKLLLDLLIERWQQPDRKILNSKMIGTDIEEALTHPHMSSFNSVQQYQANAAIGSLVGDSIENFLRAESQAKLGR